jgi:hypothetical protein
MTAARLYCIQIKQRLHCGLLPYIIVGLKISVASVISAYSKFLGSDVFSSWLHLTHITSLEWSVTQYCYSRFCNSFKGSRVETNTHTHIHSGIHTRTRTHSRPRTPTITRTHAHTFARPHTQTYTRARSRAQRTHTHTSQKPNFFSLQKGKEAETPTSFWLWSKGEGM